MNKIRRTYYKTEEYSAEQIAAMAPIENPVEIITKKLFAQLQQKYDDLLVEVTGEVMGDEFKNVESVKQHGAIEQQENGQKWFLLDDRHVLTIFPATMNHNDADYSVRCAFDYIKLY